MPGERELFSVLVVDLNGSGLSQINQQLLKESSHPTAVHVTKSVSDALQKIQRNRYHLILADSRSPDGAEEATDILQYLNKEKLNLPLIVLVPPGEEARGRRAVKSGATDFLVKSEEGLKELSHRVQSFHRHYELTAGPAGVREGIEEDIQKFTDVNEKFRKLAIRDDLTGLYNHRFFQEKLNEEFSRAIRYGHALSCLLIDIDLFRRINDSLGHSVGDEILKETAALLLENCRLSDLVGRFGGEEFSILLPHIDYQGALELAERLRELFAAQTFLAESHRISLTVSIGIACFPDDGVKQRGDLLNFSDRALFRAKAGGRNCVATYRDLAPTISEMLPHLKISEEKILEFQKRLSEISDRAHRGYMESSKALMAALESKDHFTAGHAGSVARIAKQVAEAMGLPLDEAEAVEHAGLLHDIGKICVSDEVLLKPGRYDLAEYEAMRQHPYFGYRIVKPIKFLRDEATLILHHHEWYNGEGYPCRLKGNEIPLGARIISVVDSYDTMRVAGGRYKETMSVEEATNELIRFAMRQFDPEVVQAFIQVLLMRKELGRDAYNKKLLQQALEAVSPR